MRAQTCAGGAAISTVSAIIWRVGPCACASIAAAASSAAAKNSGFTRSPSFPWLIHGARAGRTWRYAATAPLTAL